MTRMTLDDVVRWQEILRTAGAVGFATKNIAFLLEEISALTTERDEERAKRIGAEVQGHIGIEIALVKRANDAEARVTQLEVVRDAAQKHLALHDQGDAVEIQQFVSWERLRHALKALAASTTSATKPLGPERWTVHYDTLSNGTHSNCPMPEHCDCECPGCLQARDTSPNPDNSKKAETRVSDDD